MGLWIGRAEMSQEALDSCFWNDGTNLYNTVWPEDDKEEEYHYWWQAHALDNLVDAYRRTQKGIYTQRINQQYIGILKVNSGRIINNFYDDMEWMALALLRAYHSTGDEEFKEAVFTLWEDIKKGWNDCCGGGIAWRKEQLDYKNTPANAPAAILAARLYRNFKNPDDRIWAEKIYEWMKKNLVDPVTGFVWDGINREGDGNIDKDWEFTYCQGVFLGAAVELFRVSGDKKYLQEAYHTAETACQHFSSPAGILRAEGDGDGGLFKGIFVRYLGQLIEEIPSRDFLNFLSDNASSLWVSRNRDKNLFGQSWDKKTDDKISLSVHLSGIMLMEQMAFMEQKGFIENGVAME